MRNRPPTSRIRSRPENPWSSSVSSGCVRRITQVMESSSITRVTKAPASPNDRARGCCATGSRPLRMEMKMMLSMPRTTSSTESVKSEIHAFGSDSQFMEGGAGWSADATRNTRMASPTRANNPIDRTGHPRRGIRYFA